MVDQTLGHFRILEKIGQGGMGVVYRARDERLERDVALKVLPAGALADDGARRRFRKEALALAQVNHPNIGVIHDFDCEEGVDFLVMEYIPGATLSERLNAPLPEKEVARLGRQLADGLAAAHGQGIVHQDLKPGNLRVTPDERLKILDFGIAKLLRVESDGDATLTETATGKISGTVPYMSPEQLQGERVDARSDIYAAGTVLYEMATGERPFGTAHGARLIDAILHQAPEPPRAVNPKVSPELEAIILKALDKDPERRYQSAKELRVDLERLAAPTATSASVSPGRARGLKRLRQMVRAHPQVVSLTALAVLSLTMLVWWVVAAQPVFSFAPRDWILVSDFDNQTGEALFDRSLLSALSVSLEQSRHANLFPAARVAESLQRMGKAGLQKIDEATGREICQRDNVRGLVCPGIARVGRQYAISARLIEPKTGVTARSYLETASDQDHILDALGKMASAIRRDLGESWFSSWKNGRPLPQVTTKSLRGLKSYAEASALWAKGQYQQSVELFEAALKADPDFAMAHAALGGAYYSYIYNMPAEGKRHFEKALALSERTTERERLIIQADFASDLGHFQEAAERYQVYLRDYPDDWRRRFNYGGLLRANDRQEEAIAQYREILRLDSGNAGCYIDIATSYAGLDKPAEALPYYEKAFQLEPGWITSGSLNHEYGMTLVAAGQEEKAREVFGVALAKPESRPRGLRSLAWLDLYHGKYKEALGRLEEAALLDHASHANLSEVRERNLLALVYEGQGNRAAQVRELDRAMQLFPTLNLQVRPGLWLGTAYARSGRAEPSARILEIVKTHTDLNNPEQASDLHLLEGEIELAKGKKDSAMDLLRLADREKSSALTLDALARATAIAGTKEQAAAAYEQFLQERALGWEPQQSWLAGRVELAKIYLAVGEKEKAAKQLEMFTTLWKDADANLPLLKEALQLQQGLRPKP